MADMNQLFGMQGAGSVDLSGGQKFTPAVAPETDGLGDYTNDDELIALWKRCKEESFDHRHVWERVWQRTLWYVLGRQWIDWIQNAWREKRVAKGVPRPVTNKIRETVITLRSMFTAVNLGVNVRPNGSKPENVSAAATADELSPVIHEKHRMNAVQAEADFWFTTLGNYFLHVFVDYDLKHGTIEDPLEQCLGCAAEITISKRPQGTEPCPQCKGVAFQPLIDPLTGEQATRQVPKGQPTTIALSPLEVAFPNSNPRFEDIPYIIRLRWRTKWYYENHPTLKQLVTAGKIQWSKAPSERTLQLFKSLANDSDLGITPSFLSTGMSSSEDGTTEFEVQMKPCDKYPMGLVFRVIDQETPMILHLEDTEAVPGPLPYTDAEGKPLFTWTHAGFDPTGGRILASSPLDLIISKQDQLNQLDSMVMMTLMRLAAGGWIIPKGAEIENVTKLSTPGIIVRWNPLTVGGQAKPERFEGAQINDSWFKYREQIITDIETLVGTFDIIKGAKPSGVEAFSAMQLLVEQGQSRFSYPFAARGDAHKDWYKFALELEREFGPDEYTKAVLSPTRGWTIDVFNRTQLQGSVSVVVEDGSNTPKTSLGQRAAAQQAQTMGIFTLPDADLQYELLKLFGLTRLMPTLDVHKQAALQKQQAFEEWIVDPQAVMQAVQATDQATQQFQATQMQEQAVDPELAAQPGGPPPPSPVQFTPLKWLPWFKASVHKQEFDKWANSDRIRQLIKEVPGAEPLLAAHYAEMNQMLMMEMGMMQMGAGGPGGPGGGAVPGGMGLANSNNNTAAGSQPQGSGEGAQRQGPA